MPPSVVALLNTPSRAAPPARSGAPALRFVPADRPIVQALDFGVTRGDGVFETVSVGHGAPQALEAHLDRLARSASMLDMPAPDLSAWRDAVHAVLRELGPAEEAFAKLVYTRGVEGGAVPTGWVYAERSPDHRTARAEGIRVVVLDRGYPHDVASRAPWLLQGAKTLSYAMNRAATREAHRRGADDVVFTSSDGYLLEGPTSNLLLRLGERLVTPSTALGILPGTTQADAFRFAGGRGVETGYEVLPRSALDSADAAWLVSSVRHAAPVREVDGRPMVVDAAFTRDLNDFLLHRTE